MDAAPGCRNADAPSRKEGTGADGHTSSKGGRRDLERGCPVSSWNRTHPKLERAHIPVFVCGGSNTVPARRFLRRSLFLSPCSQTKPSKKGGGWVENPDGSPPPQSGPQGPGPHQRFPRRPSFVRRRISASKFLRLRVRTYYFKWWKFTVDSAAWHVLPHRPIRNGQVYVDLPRTASSGRYSAAMMGGWWRLHRAGSFRTKRPHPWPSAPA